MHRPTVCHDCTSSTPKAALTMDPGVKSNSWYRSGTVPLCPKLSTPRLTAATPIAEPSHASEWLAPSWMETMGARSGNAPLSAPGTLGVVAVLCRQELVLVVMGGVFVMETVSVILQVASFKLTGRRIFRMAPLHHHFELKGWPEPRVIVRFWVITVILVLVGLATLKVR